MSSDSEDEGDSQTWISVRSLKQAANIKTVYRSHNEEGSPHSSLNCSVTAESVPNLVINVSPSFSTLHESYLDLRTAHTKAPVQSHSRYSSSSTNQMLTRRAQEEALELHTELFNTKRELELVRAELSACEQHHSNQLQAIQAHHERKMQRHRQDLDELMRQIPKRQIETNILELRTAHEAEIKQIRRKFMEKIEILQVKQEEKLKKQEENFEEKLERIREEMRKEAEIREKDLIESQEKQLKRLEKRYKSEIQQFERPEKSLEITNLQGLKIISDFSLAIPQNPSKITNLEEILKAKTADLEALQPAKGKSSPISCVFGSEEMGKGEMWKRELGQVLCQIE